jgi:two-component system KDP operon response regulator KdpE
MLANDVGNGSASGVRTEVPAVGPLILVVDDAPPMQKMLRFVLGSHGFRTAEAASGAEALASAASYNPDLVLLDLGLPDLDGIEVTRRLREWSHAPILVISARGHEKDKVAALDLGANDYLTKPFRVGELLARIRVWLRETPAGPSQEGSVLEVGDLRIDLVRRLVSVAGRVVRLTPTEYKLFATLMRNHMRVMTHEQLLEATWGPHCAGNIQYLHVYMGRLRQKLETDSARPRYLITEAGVGYRLRAPDRSSPR